jgi:hypothetical protein
MSFGIPKSNWKIRYKSIRKFGITPQKIAVVLKAQPAGLEEKRACMTPILDRTIAGKEKQ